MKNLFFILVGFIVARCESIGDNFDFHEIWDSDLPVGVGCKSGTPIFRFQWHDETGDQYLVACSTSSKSASKSPQEISVQQIGVKDRGVPKIVWRIREFSYPDSSTIVFNKTSIAVFDFNEDRVADTRFIYHFVSGDEPRKFKYMAHIRGEKIAMRGEIPIGFDEESDCDSKWDFSIKKFPDHTQSKLKADGRDLLSKVHGCYLSMRTNFKDR
jgi:hypothetical protein